MMKLCSRTLTSTLFSTRGYSLDANPRADHARPMRKSKREERNISKQAKHNKTTNSRIRCFIRKELLTTARNDSRVFSRSVSSISSTVCEERPNKSRFYHHDRDANRWCGVGAHRQRHSSLRQMEWCRNTNLGHVTRSEFWPPSELPSSIARHRTTSLAQNNRSFFPTRLVVTKLNAFERPRVPSSNVSSVRWCFMDATTARNCWLCASSDTLSKSSTC